MKYKNICYNGRMKMETYLHKVIIDEDGESIITIKVPLTNKPHVLELLKHTKEILTVEFTISDLKPYEL